MQYAASFASAGVIVILIAYTAHQVNNATAKPPKPATVPAYCNTAINSLSCPAQAPTIYEEIVDGSSSPVTADGQ
ncbi:hypothetical protein [Chitinophaga agrisoli]|uniref:hypothetical protein n=1 Tax=Chitinophaga agrisoli TaxID=2607653 RepID=UPI001661DA92|nr:hypothetical protein [Chitinophaga agrisoli]